VLIWDTRSIWGVRSQPVNLNAILDISEALRLPKGHLQKSNDIHMNDVSLELWYNRKLCVKTQSVIKSLKLHYVIQNYYEGRRK